VEGVDAVGDVGAVGEAELSVLSPLHPNSTRTTITGTDSLTIEGVIRVLENSSSDYHPPRFAREVPPERTLEASLTRANVLAETSNPGKIQAR
jgi:hypothetical protein